jgi:hypothetical protein
MSFPAKTNNEDDPQHGRADLALQDGRSALTAMTSVLWGLRWCPAIANTLAVLIIDGLFAFIEIAEATDGTSVVTWQQSQHVLTHTFASL